jgi:hypothetical protein
MRWHTQQILRKKARSRAMQTAVEAMSCPLDTPLFLHPAAEDALQEWIVSPRLNGPAVGDDHMLARPHARLLPVSTCHGRKNLSAYRLHFLGSLLNRPSFSEHSVARWE